MGAEASPIDLQNIDYDDVLHLYRGWRRSERALNEKCSEFNLLKAKTEQLQESHVRFKAQIQSLESMKEYTMKLQSQLSRSQAENEFLTKENKSLVESTLKAETQSQELKTAAIAKNQAYRDAQSEAVTLRVQHQESLAEQKELEGRLSNEVASRASVETLLTNNDEVVDALRAENNSLRRRMDSNNARMSLYDQQLEATSLQISALSDEVARATEAKEMMVTAEAEVGVLKGDISRLLRLMDHYPASKEFLERWHVSDGMSFMGMGVPSDPSSSALVIDYGALGKCIHRNQNPIGPDTLLLHPTVRFMDIIGNPTAPSTILCDYIELEFSINYTNFLMQLRTMESLTSSKKVQQTARETSHRGNFTS